MDYVLIFKQRITAAIQSQPRNTPDVRAAVYRKTREFITFSKYAHLGPALETAIAELEREFDAAAAPPVSQTPLAGMAQQPAQRRRWRPSRRALAWVGAMVAVAAGAVLLFYRPPSDPEFDRGFADYSASARGFESIPPWSTYYRAGAEGDLRYVEATGQVPLYSKQVFPVQPGRGYTVSARLRVTRDDPKKKGAAKQVGVVAYDARGNPIGREIAPAHYCAMNQKVIAAKQGWVEASGTLTFGNANPDCLLPEGTVSVRLVAVLNVASPEAVSQIDYLRFAEAKP